LPQPIAQATLFKFSPLSLSYTPCKTRILQLLAVVKGTMLSTWVLEKNRMFSNSHPKSRHLILADSCLTDPLISHGRHFCRTIHALCNIQALLTNGLLRIGELADLPEESFTAEDMIFTLYH